MALIGKITLYVLGAIATYIICGAVVQSLWGWYVEPLGVVAISLPTAIGLSIIANLFTYPVSLLVKLTLMEPKEDSTLETALTLFMNVVMALTALGIGAVVHTFQ